MKDFIFVITHFFLPMVSVIVIPLFLAWLITRPLVKRAQKRRLEREAREEYIKMKLIEEMMKEDKANDSYHE